MTWQTVKLGDVASIDRRSIQPEHIKSGSIYVGLENIKSWGGFTNVKTVEQNDLASSKFIFNEEHVLFGKLRPYLAKIAVPDFEGICSTDILPIFPKSKLDKYYLAYFLLQPKVVQLANSLCAGANLPRISPSALLELKIPLPPLPEQKRIAAILDKAYELKRKREAAIAKLDQLAQSIFVEMFGAFLKSSVRIEMSELIEEFRYGTSNKSGKSGYPTLRIPNVARGAIDLTELKTVEVTEEEFERLKLIEGDLLFVRTNGNPDYVGRCVVFNPHDVSEIGFDTEKYIYASYLIRARLKRSSILPIVIQEYLSTDEGKQALKARCKTSAGQFNINTEGLGSLPIPKFPNVFARIFH